MSERTMKRRTRIALIVWAAVLAVTPAVLAAPRRAKPHSVILGMVRKVPYSQAGDPAGAAVGETSLPVRALLVNGVLKEWTTGEAHDVTEQSFVVQRAVRMNNSLPTDRKIEWVWQRGSWLLVDRATGHIAALRLPHYDPAVSRVVWFRNYGAYCGLSASGKSLYAVVAQIESRRPVVSEKISAFHPGNHPEPVCAAAEWQRQPLTVTFHPAGRNAVSYDILPGSTVPAEDAGGNAEAPGTAPSTPVAPASAPKP
ncbi:MAG: hypothetical protein ACP5FH_01430 [Terracidiphilus sp.]